MLNRRSIAAAAMAVLELGVGLAAKDRFVTVAPNVRLFVREQGRGSAIIALHGGPGLDLYYLAPDLEALTRHHRVIYYDQRGGGRSTLRATVTADELVADLEVLRQHLGLPRVTLLGHSWGGGLAALYAIAHPDRVDHLVLVDSIPATKKGLANYGDRLLGRLSIEENLVLYKVEKDRDEARTDRQHLELCRRYWSILAKAYYADPASVSRSHGKLCASPPAALANGLKVYTSVFNSLGDWDWRARFADLEVPTLVIHGEEDPIPLDTAREVVSALPNARLVVLPNAGHMSYVEQPDLFFAAVEDFLK